MESTALAYFHGYKDHRISWKQVHKLDTVIVITLAAIYKWCRKLVRNCRILEDEASVLSKFLDLTGGIPSHDTFDRFFSMADKVALGRYFRELNSSMASTVKDRMISIDGKRLRGSRVDSDK